MSSDQPKNGLHLSLIRAEQMRRIDPEGFERCKYAAMLDMLQGELQRTALEVALGACPHPVVQ